MSTLNESERGFQRYLRDHGYAGADDHEPDLGISRRPDFAISKNGATAVCEVKQFDSVSPLERRAAVMKGYFSSGDTEVYGPIRTQIHAGARQMRELRGRATPLVVVLANPLGRWVLLDVPHTIHALYGNPTFGGPYNAATGVIEHLAPIQGRDGELTNDHRYLSAVVLLNRRLHVLDVRDRWLDEHRAKLETDYPDRARRAAAIVEGLDGLDLSDDRDYFWVDVIHTTSARQGDAPLLSPRLFDGLHDRHWAANPDGSPLPIGRVKE
jgi:hypothetical protein